MTVHWTNFEVAQHITIRDYLLQVRASSVAREASALPTTSAATVGQFPADGQNDECEMFGCCVGTPPQNMPSCLCHHHHAINRLSLWALPVLGGKGPNASALCDDASPFASGARHQAGLVRRPTAPRDCGGAHQVPDGLGGPLSPGPQSSQRFGRQPSERILGGWKSCSTCGYCCRHLSAAAAASATTSFTMMLWRRRLLLSRRRPLPRRPRSPPPYLFARWRNSTRPSPIGP